MEEDKNTLESQSLSDGDTSLEAPTKKVKKPFVWTEKRKQAWADCRKKREAKCKEKELQRLERYVQLKEEKERVETAPEPQESESESESDEDYEIVIRNKSKHSRPVYTHTPQANITWV
jgi:hypothetical protein